MSQLSHTLTKSCDASTAKASLDRTENILPAPELPVVGWKDLFLHSCIAKWIVDMLGILMVVKVRGQVPVFCRGNRSVIESNGCCATQARVS